VQLEATGAQLSSAASFNTGVTWKPGPITIADVAAMYPYENHLVAIEISGKILRSYLEHSASFYQGIEADRVTFNPSVRMYNYDMVAGVSYTIDPTRPVGARVMSLSHQGRLIQDTDSFKMAVNSYRQGGGGGYDMLKDCPVLHDRQQSIRELIIEFLQRRGQIEPTDVLRRDWSLVFPTAASVNNVP
jgi:2',3'-cyclic-nucleotide 2'-phosphodiesterase/3'-nucleotidase